jgi:hypothetical protein
MKVITETVRTQIYERKDVIVMDAAYTFGIFS